MWLQEHNDFIQQLRSPCDRTSHRLSWQVTPARPLWVEVCLDSLTQPILWRRSEEASVETGWQKNYIFPVLYDSSPAEIKIRSAALVQIIWQTKGATIIESHRSLRFSKVCWSHWLLLLIFFFFLQWKIFRVLIGRTELGSSLEFLEDSEIKSQFLIPWKFGFPSPICNFSKCKANWSPQFLPRTLCRALFILACVIIFSCSYGDRWLN